MSIIHDALKKVQASLDRNYGRTVKPSTAPARQEPAPVKAAPIYAATVQPHRPQENPKPYPMKTMFYLGNALLILMGIILIMVLKVLDHQQSAVQNPSPLAAQRLSQRQNQIAAYQKPVSTSSRPTAIVRTPSVAQATATLQPSGISATSDSQELILNGTMLMNKERVALINDDIYVLGDLINGQEIIEITLKDVTLRSADGTTRTLKSYNRR